MYVSPFSSGSCPTQTVVPSAEAARRHAVDPRLMPVTTVPAPTTSGPLSQPADVHLELLSHLRLRSRWATSEAVAGCRQSPVERIQRRPSKRVERLGLPVVRPVRLDVQQRGAGARPVERAVGRGPVERDPALARRTGSSRGSPTRLGRRRAPRPPAATAHRGDRQRGGRRSPRRASQPRAATARRRSGRAGRARAARRAGVVLGQRPCRRGISSTSEAGQREARRAAGGAGQKASAAAAHQEQRAAEEQDREPDPRVGPVVGPARRSAAPSRPRSRPSPSSLPVGRQQQAAAAGRRPSATAAPSPRTISGARARAAPARGERSPR